MYAALTLPRSSSASDSSTRPRSRAVWCPADVVETLVAEVRITGRLNDAMLIDVTADLLAVVQTGRVREVVEQRVVPRLDVCQVLSEGDVQHWLLAHGRIKADLNEESRLADSSAGHDHAQLARSQATAATVLQNADRAVRADLICVHRLWSPRSR